MPARGCSAAVQQRSSCTHPREPGASRGGSAELPGAAGWKAASRGSWKENGLNLNLNFAVSSCHMNVTKESLVRAAETLSSSLHYFLKGHGTVKKKANTIFLCWEAAVPWWGLALGLCPTADMHTLAPPRRDTHTRGFCCIVGCLSGEQGKVLCD